MMKQPSQPVGFLLTALHALKQIEVAHLGFRLDSCHSTLGHKADYLWHLVGFLDVGTPC